MHASEDLVVALDANGTIVGSVSKIEAHTSPLVPHLAFSVFVFDTEGGLLLQQRSAEKQTFPRLWSNSCCSHPRPDEGLGEAAHRRVCEELGIAVDDLRLKGGFWYRALEESGLGEHEYDLVLTCAVLDHALDPDPAEVADFMWLAPDVVRQLPDASPEPGMTPWFGRALEVALGAAQEVAVVISR